MTYKQEARTFMRMTFMTFQFWWSNLLLLSYRTNCNIEW